MWAYSMDGKTSISYVVYITPMKLGNVILQGLCGHQVRESPCTQDYDPQREAWVT